MEKALKTFKEYLTSNSLKLTQPRLLIFKVFMSGESKMSPENLLENVQSIDDSVSRSTIYRTVKLLHNAGIARCIHSSDGATCYEPMGDQYTQMVCERCGKSFPIKNPYLECLLQETTRQQGFTLFRYQAVLYGVCCNCTGHLCSERPEELSTENKNQGECHDLPNNNQQ